MTTPPKANQPEALVPVEARVGRLMNLAGVAAHYACNLAATPDSQPAYTRYVEANRELRDAIRTTLLASAAVGPVGELQGVTDAQVDKAIAQLNLPKTTVSDMLVRNALESFAASRPVVAAPQAAVDAARMLTPQEILQALVAELNAGVKHTPHEIVQRKFCEVNGIAIIPATGEGAQS